MSASSGETWWCGEVCCAGARNKETRQPHLLGPRESGATTTSTRRAKLRPITIQSSDIRSSQTRARAPPALESPGWCADTATLLQRAAARATRRRRRRAACVGGTLPAERSSRGASRVSRTPALARPRAAPRLCGVLRWCGGVVSVVSASQWCGACSVMMRQAHLRRRKGSSSSPACCTSRPLGGRARCLRYPSGSRARGLRRGPRALVAAACLSRGPGGRLCGVVRWCGDCECQWGAVVVCGATSRAHLRRRKGSSSSGRRHRCGAAVWLGRSSRRRRRRKVKTRRLPVCCAAGSRRPRVVSGACAAQTKPPTWIVLHRGSSCAHGVVQQQLRQPGLCVKKPGSRKFAKDARFSLSCGARVEPHLQRTAGWTGGSVLHSAGEAWAVGIRAPDQFGVGVKEVQQLKQHSF